MDERPQLAQIPPPGDRAGARPPRDVPPGERGDEVPLEEPVEEPLVAGREAYATHSEALPDVSRPLEELRIGEPVSVCAARQQRQNTRVGDENVRRLHPRDVLLVCGSELAEVHEAPRDPRSRELARDVIERQQCVQLTERDVVSVPRAENADRPTTGLLFRDNPIFEDAVGGGRNELDAVRT